MRLRRSLAVHGATDTNSLARGLTRRGVRCASQRCCRAGGPVVARSFAGQRHRAEAPSPTVERSTLLPRRTGGDDRRQTGADPRRCLANRASAPPRVTDTCRCSSRSRAGASATQVRSGRHGCIRSGERESGTASPCDRRRISDGDRGDSLAAGWPRGRSRSAALGAARVHRVAPGARRGAAWRVSTALSQSALVDRRSR